MGYERLSQQKNFDEFRGNKLSEAESKATGISEIIPKNITTLLKNTGKIDKVYSIIGQGKEAMVLTAKEAGIDRALCVKIFKYYSSTNKKRIQGSHHIRAEDMAGVAAKQEYWNLKELYSHHIAVPQPIYLLNNILIMELIAHKSGSNIPAMLLKDISGETTTQTNFNPEDLLLQSIEILERMFLDAQYVHGDYSLHNLLFSQGKVYAIDVSQSVQYNQNTFVDTPIRIRIDKAATILKRDLANLLQGFEQKFRVRADLEEIYQGILAQLPNRLAKHVTTQTSVNSIKYYNGDIIKLKESYRNQCRRKGRQRSSHQRH